MLIPKYVHLSPIQGEGVWPHFFSDRGRVSPSPYRESPLRENSFFRSPGLPLSVSFKRLTPFRKPVEGRFTRHFSTIMELKQPHGEGQGGAWPSVPDPEPRGVFSCRRPVLSWSIISPHPDAEPEVPSLYAKCVETFLLSPLVFLSLIFVTTLQVLFSPPSCGRLS